MIEMRTDPHAEEEIRVVMSDISRQLRERYHLCRRAGQRSGWDRSNEVRTLESMSVETLLRKITGDKRWQIGMGRREATTSGSRIGSLQRGAVQPRR